MEKGLWVEAGRWFRNLLQFSGEMRGVRRDGMNQGVLGSNIDGRVDGLDESVKETES